MSIETLKERLQDLLFSAKEGRNELQQEVDYATKRYNDWEDEDEETRDPNEPEIPDNDEAIDKLDNAIISIEAAIEDLS